MITDKGIEHGDAGPVHQPWFDWAAERGPIRLTDGRVCRLVLYKKNPRMKMKVLYRGRFIMVERELLEGVATKDELIGHMLEVRASERAAHDSSR